MNVFDTIVKEDLNECTVRECKKVTVRNRVRKTKGSRCSRCRMAVCRQQNPVRYSFTKLKANAKRRGIPFQLTLDEFEQFCDSNPEFLALRGRTADSWSLDRIRGNEPYRLDNLQVLTVSDNSVKSHVDLRIPADEHPFGESF